MRRRKSPKTVESVSETLKISEKKANNKAPKIKLSERRHENVEKHSALDVDKVKPRTLTVFTCAPSSPTFMSENQVKAMKKTKGIRFS